MQQVFSVQLAFGATHPQSGLRADFATPHVDGKWHHLMMTYDGAAAILWEDGTAVASKSGGVGTLAVYAQAVEIGRVTHGYHGPTSHFCGLIDDVRIYNRALTTNEVQQLYALESQPLLNVRKAVYLDSNKLSVGTNYQIQVSTDMKAWTDYGTPFVATNAVWRTTNYWDVLNWNNLYFRLQVVP